MVTKTLSAFVKFLSVGFLSFTAIAGPNLAHGMTCENIFESVLSNEVAIERLADLDAVLQTLPLDPPVLVEKMDALSRLTDTAFENQTLDRALAIEIRELETWAQNHLLRGNLRSPLATAAMIEGVISIAPPPPVAIKLRTVERSRTAIKDERDLIPHLRSKFQNFVTDLESAENPLKLDSHWKLEKIRHLAEVDHSGTFFSVRLNGSYRVVFSIEDGNKITILRLSNTVTHAGH